MKRIKKVSQTVPTSAQVVDGYADTTTDSYSTNYQNAHNVIVSATTPTTNERVWFKHSRNIASDITLKNGLWTSASGISTNANGWYVIESVNPNTTYTITKKNTVGTLVVNATATKPANGVSTSNRQNVSGNTKVTFTTNSTDKYLFIGLFAGSPTETQKTECIEELQVIEGDEEIPYEPYIEASSIVVDGDEIYSKPVVLYNNSSGIQDNIPLNDNYTNYNYLEIFGYTNNDGTIYKKITTDRNTFELSTLLPIIGNPIIQMYANIYSLNGTNITLTRYLRNNANNNQPNTISESNGIYITKILGYK